jgi:hypothetical protein
MLDYVDFYILGPEDPSFNDTNIIEDDIIQVIIQKYKSIIFTNKGDVLGDPNFGADIELLLYETKVSEDYVTKIIIEQINTYIPELVNMNYSLELAFAQDATTFQDAMFIYFTIADYEVYAQFGVSIN